MKTIRLTRGDTTAVSIYLSTADGSEFILGGGDTARLIVFKRGQPVMRKTLTYEQQDSESGRIIVLFDSADTERLAGGIYQFELEVVLADGVVHTPIKGQIMLIPDMITPDNREEAADA